MQPKPKPPRYRALYLLVALACVGLVSAVSHKRVRQLELEGLRPPEPPEPRQARSTPAMTNGFEMIAAQGMSFRIERQANPEDLSAPPQMLLDSRREQPDSPIIESIPAALLERARKDLDYSSITNTTVVPVAPTGEKIVVE